MAQKKVTIADVAREAGVSVGAVSFALNGRPGVGEQTRTRILDAAARLDWQPSLRARSLSTSRAFALGLVVARRPELIGTDPFFPAFIAGVESVLAPVGQSLVLNVVIDPDAEASTYRRLAGEGRVDGVFVTDLRRLDPRIPLLAELGLPAVTLGHPDQPSSFPAISVDDAAGVAALVGLLTESGHRRIACVSGPPEMLHAQHRVAAWQEAMAAAGLDAALLVPSDFSAAGGAAATEALLALGDPPTAIVYGNDVMAIAGMAVAQQRGLRLPDQLSVTGFDDTELARHLHPPLTTVRTDAFAWGSTAATVLLEVIDGQTAADVDLPPLPLARRGSVGSAPRPVRRATSSRS